MNTGAAHRERPIETHCSLGVFFVASATTLSVSKALGGRHNEHSDS